MTQLEATTPQPSGREAIFARVRRLAYAAAQKSTALDSDGFTEEERAGGALLDALAQELRPALRDASSSLVFGDPLRDFFLTPEGKFLRFEAGSKWPVRHTAVLTRIEPDIRAILDDLEAGLLGAERPQATQAAALVAEVRSAIDSTLPRGSE